MQHTRLCINMHVHSICIALCLYLYMYTTLSKGKLEGVTSQVKTFTLLEALSPKPSQLRAIPC